MAIDKERKFRLRPRKPAARSERIPLAFAYKTIVHYARMTSRLRRASRLTTRQYHSRSHLQRCAVRVTYSRNATRGQWRAHGRYLVRESATFDGTARGAGFDAERETAEIAQRLESWQRAGDERLWKLIVSPEFGDRTDLTKLTRDLLSQMEQDLGTPLEWLAVAHYNTEHPHVHVACRGVRVDGNPLRLGREYIKEGIREVAQDLCTRQLGYRTELDAVASRRREIDANRYTSLDAAITRSGIGMQVEASGAFLIVPIGAAEGTECTRLLKQHMTERLLVLKTMGLAEHAGPNLWQVRRDFEQVLRAMQRGADRQKTLASFGAPISDERLPVTTIDLRSLTNLEGRILVHGEDEFYGRGYLMLEGTDARIHYVYYTPEMEAARNRGELGINSFIRLHKRFTEGRPVIEIDELGDAEAILANRSYVRETAKRLIRSGVVPQEEGWKGWLGRYQKALAETAKALVRGRLGDQTDRRKTRERGR